MTSLEKIAAKENIVKDLIIDESYPGLVDGWQESDMLYQNRVCTGYRRRGPKIAGCYRRIGASSIRPDGELF